MKKEVHVRRYAASRRRWCEVRKVEESALHKYAEAQKDQCGGTLSSRQCRCISKLRYAEQQKDQVRICAVQTQKSYRYPQVYSGEVAGLF